MKLPTKEEVENKAKEFAENIDKPITYVNGWLACYEIFIKPLKQANEAEQSLDSCHIQNVTHSAYQLCPKCNGQGIVSKPPWVAGDVYEWSSTQTQFTCDVCNGSKIIPLHCG